MEPRFIQHQSQKLVLSPQIRQYLKLLQLPLADLEQAVETELTENPLLEEKPAPSISPFEESDTEEPGPSEKIKYQEFEAGKNFEDINAHEERFHMHYDYPDFAKRNIKDLEEQKNYQESILTRPEALSDYLLWQTGFLNLTEDQKKIALEIIGNINETGYLQATNEEISAAVQASPEEVQKIILIIQQLEPPGVGARSLSEALSIQLKKKESEILSGESSSSQKKQLEEIRLALLIIRDHLSLLEKRDWNALAKQLAADPEKIKRAAALISRLEPRPGRTFYAEEPIAVAPDAAILPEEDDEEKFRIEIHDERIPEIRINPYYRQLLRDKSMDQKSADFLKEKMQAATNFMRALHLRKSTLREITEEIVKAQHEFLQKGFLHLKPLRLRDIADTLGIHESTVSRAIHGKYVSTPQGTLPYKSFFSNAMGSSEGSAESQKSTMEKIKLAIDKETPGKALSDQALVELLQKDGIVIARRTVAKYRELLKILPSHLRKKK